MYINLLNNEIIPDENIIKETDLGLTFFSNNCWHFLGKDQYQLIEGKSVVFSYAPASIKDTVLNGAINPDTVNTNTFKYYTYFLGVNNIDISKKNFAESSAILSDPLSVNVGQNLYLDVKMHYEQNSSIEFYIIDGIDETAILPLNETQIEHEKRFIGLPTRFTGSNFIYYKNKKETPEEDIALDDSLYTVSYTPNQKHQVYTPKNSIIKIKTILRLYDKNAPAPYIENLTIKQG